MHRPIRRYRLSVAHIVPRCAAIRHLNIAGLHQAQPHIKPSSAQTIVQQSTILSWRLALGAVIVLGTGVFIGYNRSNLKIRPRLLKPEVFSGFTLVSKEIASPTSSIFTLKQTHSILSSDLSNVYSDAWMKGVWSLQIKQPQLQIARSYTPLPPNQADETLTSLCLLVRREPQGEVSTYLHRLHLGDTVELRGPHNEFEIPENVSNILFIAGGTGIAPALQVAHTLFESRKSRQLIPKLHILWANRGMEDSRGGISDTKQSSIGNLKYWKTWLWPSTKNHDFLETSQSPLVRKLEALKSSNNGNITVDYFVDELGSYITDDVLKQYFARHISKVPGAPSAPNAKRLILISGPEGFIKHYAGPKVWARGQELQGPLGGTLKSIRPGDWDIWKL